MPNCLSWSTLAHRDILNFWVLWTLAMDRGDERVNWDVNFIPAWDFLLLTITFKKVNLTKSSLDFKFALVVPAWFWQVGLFEMFCRGEENSIHSLLCDMVSCSIETQLPQERFSFSVFPRAFTFVMAFLLDVGWRGSLKDPGNPLMKKEPCRASGLVSNHSRLNQGVLRPLMCPIRPWKSQISNLTLSFTLGPLSQQWKELGSFSRFFFLILSASCLGEHSSLYFYATIHFWWVVTKLCQPQNHFSIYGPQAASANIQ